jgi:class 3 adenylate cyclase/tetratricopeptide (TPR) repeat protein
VTIRCASCGAEQPAEARFCSSCGAALYVACPNCGAEQAASASFCASCGYALGDDARAAGADDRQERRVVTILFADLAGSTALGEQLDPEDVRDLQGNLFELVNREVERFGGTTEKFVGDAVLAVFGIPRAHEDDPERAVRAGLAAQERFRTFAGSVRDRFGGDVGLRIGVNTGEVVAGREAAARGELMVSGDAVNVAARLQQAAEPGQVVVGERTHGATSRSIAYAGPAAVAAKGKSDPVAAWVAVEALEEPGARPVAALHAPLVGRTEELAILTAVAGRVEREHAPQLVTLYGPAGVGKSRLLAELVERLPHALLLQGRCLPYGEEIAYWPLAEAAKAQAGILDTDSTGTALEKLHRSVAEAVPDEAGQVSEALAWTIGLALPDAAAAGEVTQRLQTAWQLYLTALGRERLTILAIEDIHWASTPLLDLLEGLSDALTDTSILVVCTARVELLDVRPTWGAAKQNATALTLAPLDGEKAAQLVSSLLGEDGVPEEVRERVLASAEGNPFFVEELLHMLIEQGALERRGDGWTTADALAELPLPDSIHGVIAARIDLLEADSRDALRRCSVIGRVFWPDAAGVSERCVAALGRRDLILQQPTSSMAGMKEFAFKHALTREVAYASLPRSERRDLHRRVAEWVQEVAPDRGVEAAELAAYHYGEALRYGEDDPAVARRAYELLMTAAEAALQRGALTVAAAVFQRAADHAPDDPGLAAAVLGLGRVDVSAGAEETELPLDRALERFDASLRLADPADASFRGDVLGWKSRVLWLLGRWDEAMAAADEAVAVLRGLPESPQLARVLARRAQLAMLRDDDDAPALAAEGLDVATRVGDRFAMVNVTISGTVVAAQRGTAPDPAEMLETIDAAREAGAFEEAFRALVNFLWSASGYLPVDETGRAAEAARARLTGLVPPTWVDAYLDLSLALQHLIPAGRWDEATQLLGRWGPDDLTPNNRIPWLGAVAQLELRRGDVEKAGALVREQHDLAIKTREPQRIIPMANALLAWAAVANEREQLRAHAEEVLELVGDRSSGVISALPATRAIAISDDDELLRRWTGAITRATERSRRGGRIVATESAARGLVALHEGRPAEAAELLQESASTERRLGYLFDAATVELDLARALEASGDAARAGEVRSEAEAFLRSIGAVNPL